ncbi:MAG: zinc ribbon domain-containing protein [Methanolobus sp.]|nr:zinc ribbon domain-containing protein [Methanolobus sp.]
MNTMKIPTGKRHYRETTKADWHRTIGLLLIFFTVITASSFLLLPGHWYIWHSIVALGMLIIIAWHTKNFAYRCPNCGKTFDISIITNFLGLNNFDKKYLKCPHCGKRGWAKVLVIVPAADAIKT